MFDALRGFKRDEKNVTINLEEYEKNLRKPEKYEEIWDYINKIEKIDKNYKSLVDIYLNRIY